MHSNPINRYHLMPGLSSLCHEIMIDRQDEGSGPFAYLLAFYQTFTMSPGLQARDEEIAELRGSISQYMDRVVKARFEQQEAFEQREAAQRITNHLQVHSARIPLFACQASVLITRHLPARLFQQKSF